MKIPALFGNNKGFTTNQAIIVFVVGVGLVITYMVSNLVNSSKQAAQTAKDLAGAQSQLKAAVDYVGNPAGMIAEYHQLCKKNQDQPAVDTGALLSRLAEAKNELKNIPTHAERIHKNEAAYISRYLALSGSLEQMFKQFQDALDEQRNKRSAPPPVNPPTPDSNIQNYIPPQWEPSRPGIPLPTGDQPYWDGTYWRSPDGRLVFNGSTWNTPDGQMQWTGQQWYSGDGQQVFNGQQWVPVGQPYAGYQRPGGGVNAGGNTGYGSPRGGGYPGDEAVMGQGGGA